MKYYFVYILSNKTRTTFYIGVTNDLHRRVVEHYSLMGSKFTKKYKLTDLVYFEHFAEVRQAIQREKQLKNWHRDWKLNLIRTVNPGMIDLKLTLMDGFGDSETSSE